jgi:hypothetical protein
MSADDLRGMLRLLGCERLALVDVEGQVHLELWANDTHRFILEAWPEVTPYPDRLYVQVEDMGQFLPAPMAKAVH